MQACVDALKITTFLKANLFKAPQYFLNIDGTFATPQTQHSISLQE
jgi:hypothetical protein